MDQDAIFTKTQAGEEVIQHRTRLVQRNLRNILIMVDGHSTVAELSQRFGYPGVVERSLVDLEKGGLIERLFPPEAGNDAPAAEQAVPAALEEGEIQEELPILTIVAPAPAPAPTSAQPEPIIIPPAEIDPMPTTPAQATPPIPAIGKAAPPLVRLPPDEPAAAGWMDNLRKRLFRRKEAPAGDRIAAPENETVTIKPIRRGPRTYVSGWLVGVGVFLAAILVPGLLAVFYPYDRHLPDIERWASAVLAEPVKAAHVRFAFLPYPNIAIEGIEIGKDRYLTIRQARVVPDFLSLLGEKISVTDVQLEGVALSGRGFERLARWYLDGDKTQRIVVGHAGIAGLKLVLGDDAFEGISGEIELNSFGRMDRILLRTSDSSLKMEIRPKGSVFDLSVFGSAWSMPFRPNLVLSHLEAEGDLAATRLELRKFDGRLYNGIFSGQAALDWSEGTALSGEFALKRLDLAKLVPALDKNAIADGEVDGLVRLSSKADSPSALGEKMLMEIAFEARRGSVRGYDLIEAVRSSSRNPTRGGSLKFEQFNGNLLVDHEAYRFNNLRINSGVMKAAGNLFVGRDRSISGLMEVEMKGTAAVVKAPLSIRGTTKDPYLQSARGATGSPN